MFVLTWWIIFSHSIIYSSPHLICFVAQSDIFPLQVHLVHGDPSAGWGLLGDASAGHGSTREAGGLAVGVVGAAPLGRRVLAAVVDRSRVSWCRGATRCHFDGRGAWGETQPADTNRMMIINWVSLLFVEQSHCELLVNKPLLLSFQQLPVGTNLHIQSQLDVQQLLVLVQLLLHLLPHLGHFSVLLSQQAASGVPLPRQSVLQVPYLRLTGRQLDQTEELHS